MKLRCERPSNLDLTSEVNADVRSLRVDEKMKEVLKTASIYLGLAVVSVFIPVFHFILVPLFLVLAIVFGFKAKNRDERLLNEVSLSCLSCASNIVLKPMTFEWPLTFRCPKCAEPHRLSPL